MAEGGVGAEVCFGSLESQHASRSPLYLAKIVWQRGDAHPLRAAGCTLAKGTCLPPGTGASPLQSSFCPSHQAEGLSLKRTTLQGAWCST